MVGKTGFRSSDERWLFEGYLAHDGRHIMDIMPGLGQVFKGPVVRFGNQKASQPPPRFLDISSQELGGATVPNTQSLQATTKKHLHQGVLKKGMYLTL